MERMNKSPFPGWQDAHKNYRSIVLAKESCVNCRIEVFGETAVVSGLALLVLASAAHRFQLWFDHALVTIWADAVAELGFGMGADI